MKLQRSFVQPRRWVAHPELNNSNDTPHLNLRLPDRPLFGFEVETETRPEPIDGRSISRFGWVPCSDGSIRGAEWKSPFYFSDERFPEPIEKIIQSSEISRSCGGHIHVLAKHFGKEGITSHDLAMSVTRNWQWLFAALYPERVTSYYCQAVVLKASELKYRKNNDKTALIIWGPEGKDKLKAFPQNLFPYCLTKSYIVNPKESVHIEFRIFPGTNDPQTLYNRAAFLETFIKHHHLAGSIDEAYDVMREAIAPSLPEVFTGFPWKSAEPILSQKICVPSTWHQVRYGFINGNVPKEQTTIHNPKIKHDFVGEAKV